jgi:two-component sensor histidine kinase/ligand-binding sensor domain-containing protein
MERLLRILVFCAAAFISTPGNSQNLRFEHFGTEDGLSQSNVNCILQDSRGFIWVGTRGGLNRYDGYRFIIYHYDAKDTSSLSDDFVADIAEDDSGNLWIATKNGLNEFHRKTSTFTHYLHDEHNSYSISDNALNKLVFDKNGELWIATQLNGLDCFNIQQKRFKHFRSSIEDKNSISDNSIRTVFCDSRNRIWAGTFDGGLNCFNAENESFEKFYIKNDEGNLVGQNIPCIFEDGNKQLWIGTQSDGLFLLDREKKSFQAFKSSSKNANTISSNTVFSLGEDATGNLWIGTENGGLCVMDRKTKQIQRYLHDDIDQYSINGNSIYAICQDRQHNIWLGTFSAGINLHKSNTANFIHYRHTSSPNSLSNNFVLDIFEDSKKNTWIATDGGGVNLKHAGLDSFIHYKKQQNGLSGNYVLVVREMMGGDIWMGTWGDGISIYNPQTKTFKYLKHDPGNNNSISSDYIYSIVQTRDKKIWIGSSGVDCYDEATKKFEHYKHDDKDSNSISSNLILSLLEDTKGNLWIGTYDNGLNFFDRNKKIFTHYLHSTNANSISSSTIPDILEDSKGNLWISTFHGLDKFDMRKKRITTYTSDDGLPANTIYATEEDKDGNIWISTNNGLSVYNISTAKFRNYTTDDGLQGDEFKPHSALRASNDNLYFGGINGFNVFNPEKIKRPTEFSPVVITSFQIFNKPVPIAKNEDAKSSLIQDISETKAVTLSYNQTVISFEFAALDFNATPEKKKYAYILQGFDNDWNYVGSRNSAYYTNLSPGHYDFKIKYQNSFGEWSPIYSKLKVTVVPPFWLTWWFKTLIGIVLAGAAYAFFKIRLHSIKSQKIALEKQVSKKTKEVLHQKEILEIQQQDINKKNKSLEGLLKEKDWLLREVHHRVKNDLQIIISLLNTQSSYLKDEAALSAILESKQRIYSISLIHEKLYRPENVAYVNMHSYISELISYLNDSFNASPAISVQAAVEPVVMDVAQALPVGLILNEAITNSMKYAFPNNESGLIYVSLSRLSSGNVLLKVNDNGVGFLSPPDGETNSSLGFSLIKGLSEQLDAKLDIKHEKGVFISLEFPYVEPLKFS